MNRGVISMKKEFERIYHDLEGDNFWFKARRSCICDILRNFPKDSTVLDIGCSSGVLLKELKTQGFDERKLYGIDISEKAIASCRENGFQNTWVMDAQKIQLDQKFDVIIASDCLEHLSDDSKALCQWNRLLIRNGVLIVFVPAFNILWGEHDVENMHFRRYSKKELNEKVTASDLTIMKSSYWNCSLFLPILFVRLLSRFKISRRTPAGDLRRLGCLNEILFQMLKMENKLLKYCCLPFGVSVYCIAKKDR